jgi:hypothetical protein
MSESVHVKFNETTNFGVEKCHFIVGDRAKNINATNKSQAIIIKNV